MLKFHYVDLEIQFKEFKSHLLIKVFTRGFKNELALIITKTKEFKSNLTISDISSYITFSDALSLTNLMALKIQSVKTIDPFSRTFFCSGRVAINE